MSPPCAGVMEVPKGYDFLIFEGGEIQPVQSARPSEFGINDSGSAGSRGDIAAPHALRELEVLRHRDRPRAFGSEP